jgi:hypothetical protein
LNYTLGRDGEVFCIQALLVFFNLEVVGAELTSLNLLAVTVEELNGHGDTVFSEETDGVEAGFDTVLEFPDLSALLNEVSLG